MLNAAPEEILDFNHAVNSDVISENDETKFELTPRQKKLLRQKISDFKLKVNKRLDDKIKSRKASVCPLPPRYDDVFSEGLAKLDEAAGTYPSEGNYLANFTNGVWKSTARHDPEIS